MKPKHFLILLAAVLLGIGFYTWKKPHLFSSTKLGKANLDANQKAQYESDQNAIANSASSEQDLEGAIVRLAEKNDPQAKSMAFSRMSSENPLVRKNSAQALGYLDDPDSLVALEKLIQDSDETVRMTAMESLSFRMNPARIEILKKIYARKEATPFERIEAATSLASFSMNPNERKTYVDAVIKEIESQKAGTDNYDRAVGMGLHRLSGASPMDPRLQSFAMKELSAAAEPAKAPVSGNRAAAVLASLHTLHLSCPPERVSLLEKIISNKGQDPRILLGAMIELRYLESTKADAILNKAIKENWVPATFHPSPQQILDQIHARAGTAIPLSHCKP